MTQLTPRQREVLEFVRSYIREHGFSPSVREIMTNFGWSSTNAVNDHLELMEKKGALRRTAGIPRSIVLTTPSLPDQYPTNASHDAKMHSMKPLTYADIITLPSRSTLRCRPSDDYQWWSSVTYEMPGVVSLSEDGLRELSQRNNSADVDVVNDADGMEVVLWLKRNKSSR